MRIAVTGASGHIGGAVCRELLRRGYEVVALIHHNDSAVLDLRVTIVKGNISNQNSLDELIGQCDAVIHSAALISLGYGFNQRVYDINVSGTKYVLDKAKQYGVKKVVHFSSIDAFDPFPGNLPLDESRSFVTDQSIFYDQTKREAHQLALDAASEGLPVVIVCPTAVLGPPDYTPSKLGKAIMDIYKGNIPAVVRGGFDFSDVRDVASGAVLALEKGMAGETYILGGAYYTLKQFADNILEIKGVGKRLIELPMFLADLGLPFVKGYAFLANRPPLYDRTYLNILQDGSRNISSRKAQQNLGYQCRDLMTTLTDTIKWFREMDKL